MKSHWAQLIGEDRKQEEKEDKQRKRIKRLLVGRMCPERSQVINKINKERGETKWQK